MPDLKIYTRLKYCYVRKKVNWIHATEDFWVVFHQSIQVETLEFRLGTLGNGLSEDGEVIVRPKHFKGKQSSESIISRFLTD
jgi:hypothetical protein